MGLTESFDVRVQSGGFMVWVYGTISELDVIALWASLEY